MWRDILGIRKSEAIGMLIKVANRNMTASALGTAGAGQGAAVQPRRT